MSNSLQDILDSINEEYIIGIDEVGTGAIAGPITVAGVLAKKDFNLKDLNDSKKFSSPGQKKIRKSLSELIKENSVYAIASASNHKIKQKSHAQAQKDLYLEVIKELLSKINEQPKIILDGKAKLDISSISTFQVQTIIKADSIVPHVMAASILAKEERDAIMIEFHNTYPEYNWKSNKGYATKSHKDALLKNGISSIHRQNTKPVQDIMMANNDYAFLVGKTKEEAISFLKEHSIDFRFVMRDGQHLTVTCDYLTDRVNLLEKDNVIIEVSMG